MRVCLSLLLFLCLSELCAEELFCSGSLASEERLDIELASQLQSGFELGIFDFDFIRYLEEGGREFDSFYWPAQGIPHLRAVKWVVSKVDPQRVSEVARELMKELILDKERETQAIEVDKESVRLVFDPVMKSWNHLFNEWIARKKKVNKSTIRLRGIKKIWIGREEVLALYLTYSQIGMRDELVGVALATLPGLNISDVNENVHALKWLCVNKSDGNLVIVNEEDCSSAKQLFKVENPFYLNQELQFTYERIPKDWPGFTDDVKDIIENSHGRYFGFLFEGERFFLHLSSNHLQLDRVGDSMVSLGVKKLDYFPSRSFRVDFFQGQPYLFFEVANHILMVRLFTQY